MNVDLKDGFQIRCCSSESNPGFNPGSGFRPRFFRSKNTVHQKTRIFLFKKMELLLLRPNIKDILKKPLASSENIFKYFNRIRIRIADQIRWPEVPWAPSWAWWRPAWPPCSLPWSQSSSSSPSCSSSGPKMRMQLLMYELYSTLLHLPPLRFHCVGEDAGIKPTDYCEFGPGSRTL